MKKSSMLSADDWGEGEEGGCAGECLGDECTGECLGGKCTGECLGGECTGECLGGKCTDECLGGECTGECLGGECTGECLGGECAGDTRGECTGECKGDDFGGRPARTPACPCARPGGTSDAAKGDVRVGEASGDECRGTCACACGAGVGGGRRRVSVGGATRGVSGIGVSSSPVFTAAPGVVPQDQYTPMAALTPGGDVLASNAVPLSVGPKAALGAALRVAGKSQSCMWALSSSPGGVRTATEGVVMVAAGTGAE